MSIRMADHCPYCGKGIEAVTAAIDDSDIPGPGDITICFYCAGVCRFDDDMKMVKMTLRDWRWMDAATKRELRTAQSFVRSFQKAVRETEKET